MTQSLRYSTTLTALAFLVLLVPMTALAQRASHGQVMLGDRNSNQARNAGYVSKYALEAGVRRLAYQSTRFQWRLESEMNRTYLDGTVGEKRANQLSARFNKAAETLHSLYAVGRNVDNSAAEAGNLLRLGDQLDDFLSRAPVSRATLESWDAISCELSSLAIVYDFDAAAVEDVVTQDHASIQEIEYQSAALSYGRIWIWPF